MKTSFVYKFAILTVLFAICSNAEKPTEKDLSQTVASYLSSIKTMSCTIKKLDSTDIDETSDLFLKSGKSPKIRIRPKIKSSQDIFISGTTLSIFDPKFQKIHKTSISGSPIYQLLTGTLDLRKHKIEIFAEDKEAVAYSIDKSDANNIPLKLVFAKYSNGNLKYLIGWEIDDGKSLTKYGVIEKTIRINDPKSVPDSVFKLSSSK